MCIRYRGNVSTETLPVNEKGIFTEPLSTNNKGTLTKPLPSSDSGYTHTLARTHSNMISKAYYYFFRIRKLS
jgi:hypothetical protein